MDKLGINFSGRVFVVSATEEKMQGSSEVMVKVVMAGSDGQFESWLTGDRRELAPPAATLCDVAGVLRIKPKKGYFQTQLFLQECTPIGKMSPIVPNGSNVSGSQAAPAAAPSSSKKAAVL